MNITKKFGIVELSKDDKKLSFIYGGNLDLYWAINSRNDDMSFEITKENYKVYSLFEQLYDDIENINFHETMPFYVNSLEEFTRYNKDIEEDKKRYREYNFSHYKELFNKNKNQIVWYSDETNPKVANYFILRKLEDKFIVEFHTQEYVDGYDRECNHEGSISVRISNSGSHYDPFNIMFMTMFNQFKNVDDVEDEFHQYHIEEYMYESQKLSLKK